MLIVLITFSSNLLYVGETLTGCNSFSISKIFTLRRGVKNYFFNHSVGNVALYKLSGKEWEHGQIPSVKLERFYLK